LRGRLSDAGGLEGWRMALDRAQASPFLSGQTQAGFRCTFDFLTKQANFTKLMEGNYDPRTSNTNGSNTISSNGRQDRIDPALEQIARLTGLSLASS